MTQIVIHLGLHKTATTTLQRQVFPSWPGLEFVYRDSTTVEFVRAAVLTDPIYFDHDFWQRKLAIEDSSHDVVMISSESLSGSLFAGVGKRSLDHRSSILLNLKAAVPGAKILVVIRRQDDLARSIYRQYLKVGGAESVGEFFGIDSARSGIFSRNRFLYGPYIEKLYELFPAGVLVLTFEEFKARPMKFLGEIAGLLEIPEPTVDIEKTNETRFGSWGMEISRLTNFAFRSRFNPGGIIPGIPVVRNGRLRLVSLSSIIHNRWPGRKSRLRDASSRIERACEQIFLECQDDNKAVDDKYNLGLKSYGYY